MVTIQLDRIVKRYNDTVAIDNVSLAIPAGEFLTLLGPSGCGKSTTLRTVAGLISPDQGRITFGDRDVTSVPVYERNVGMVFQSLALFPHMTVGENVGFGLRMRNLARPDRERRVREALALVRLPGYETRYPHQMSGGQQQRVALARALVINPAVLLLDEPFGALDRKLRESMQAELHRLTRAIEVTTLFVTHDQEEALMLSDRIAVMNSGRVEQWGTPSELFETPLSAFVADFMGVNNIFPAQVVDADRGGAKVHAVGMVFDVDGANLSRGQTIAIAIRPERIRLSDTRSGGQSGLGGRIALATYHGSVSNYEVVIDGSDLRLVVREPNPHGGAGCRLRPGDDVRLDWHPSVVRVLPEAPVAARSAN